MVSVSKKGSLPARLLLEERDGAIEVGRGQVRNALDFEVCEEARLISADAVHHF